MLIASFRAAHFCSSPSRPPRAPRRRRRRGGRAQPRRAAEDLGGSRLRRSRRPDQPRLSPTAATTNSGSSSWPRSSSAASSSRPPPSHTRSKHLDDADAVSADAEIVVRSYRRVFRLERRIYRIDRFVIPVPGGIPSAAWPTSSRRCSASSWLSGLPGLGSLLAFAPLPIRLFVLPAGVAVLATQATPDGLPAHRFARAWIGVRLRPARTWDGSRLPAAGERVGLGRECPYSPDSDDPRLRRARVHGPARIEFRAPVSLERCRGGWNARPVDCDAGSARILELNAEQRLEVRL